MIKPFSTSAVPSYILASRVAGVGLIFPAFLCCNSILVWPQAHTLSRRRQVPGRSDLFDKMLAAHRAARKASATERQTSVPFTEGVEKPAAESDVRSRAHISLNLDVKPDPTKLGTATLDTPPSAERHSM